MRGVLGDAGAPPDGLGSVSNHGADHAGDGGEPAAVHHPLRIAEEVATLDVLSGGRAVFGIGRGSNPNHYPGYGIPIEERNDRLSRAWTWRCGAWTEDELDYHGRFYQAEGIRLEPKPIQQPYPPVYIASNGADTFPLVGSLGHSILVTPLIITVQGVSDGLAAYRETLAEHGHDASQAKVVVNVPVYVGETCRICQGGFRSYGEQLSRHPAQYAKQLTRFRARLSDRIRRPVQRTGRHRHSRTGDRAARGISRTVQPAGDHGAGLTSAVC